MDKSFSLILSFCVIFALVGCKSEPFSALSGAPSKLSGIKHNLATKLSLESAQMPKEQALSMAQILQSAAENKNVGGSDFREALGLAVISSPEIIAANFALESRKSAVNIEISNKDFQVLGNVYGGIEDVTDKTVGVAVALSARREIFDFGKLDAKIAARKFEVVAAEKGLLAAKDKRAVELASIWVDLELFQELNTLIQSRLDVLDPLIGQVEEVAKAGVGDVSLVAAAQRTVASIRDTQTDVAEKLENAKLTFVNEFGFLPEPRTFDQNFITGLMPGSVTEEISQTAPLLLSKYASYQTALQVLHVAKTRDKFGVSFESNITRPFGGSERDSSESVGFILNKTLYSGNMIESEIQKAQSSVDESIAELQRVAREGEKAVRLALQNIESMDKAIMLAQQNAKVTSDEILYLRKQLVIGGSTLDSVLSAEARLYEAESKEIYYLAERRKSQLTMLGTLGLMSPSLGIDQ